MVARNGEGSGNQEKVFGVKRDSEKEGWEGAAMGGGH